ncbi:hypothetical protein [Kitasatospora sp. NPDC088783]|uniref:hypothetical protein n=1 Tax=Kitasatospora sp. NPDC088783 TaxID=3364077 RepID=UPI00381C4B2D
MLLVALIALALIAWAITHLSVPVLLAALAVGAAWALFGKHHRGTGRPTRR